MAGRPPRPLPASLQRLVSVFEREGDAESEQASAEARNIGFSRARPSMADRPPRPLPASFQSHDSDSDNGMNADPVSQRSSVEILEVQPISAIADEEISCISDHSMSAEELEEDDLLDDEEEYQQVLEEQRIMDEKNGHFEYNFQSPMKMTATAEEVAAYITRSLAVAPVFQDGSLAEEVTCCLEKEKVYGNPGRNADASLPHGEEAVFPEMMGQSFFDNCSAVETTMHGCIGSVQALNAKPDSTSLVGTKKYGSTPDFMEQKHQQLSSKNARLDGEENASLDLEENRPLVVQHNTLGLQRGPQLAGSAQLCSGQVSSPSGPSSIDFISAQQPLSPQPMCPAQIPISNLIPSSSLNISQPVTTPSPISSHSAQNPHQTCTSLPTQIVSSQSIRPTPASLSNSQQPKPPIPSTQNVTPSSNNHQIKAKPPYPKLLSF